MPTTTKKPIRKRGRKPTLKSVLKEPKNPGPFYSSDDATSLKTGKLDKLFESFIDPDTGLSLSRDDIISMAQYLAQSEPPSDDLTKQGVMTKWWNSYVGRHRNPSLRYETICIHAGISVDEFYGKISRLYHYLTKENAINRLRGSLPSIVKATVDAAKLPDGAKDREMIFKMNEMAGLQPASTNINLSQNVNMANFSAAGIPNFETSQAQMTGAVISQVKQHVLGSGEQNYINLEPIVEREKEYVPIQSKEEPPANQRSN